MDTKPHENLRAKRQSRTTNVVSMRLDAAFFYERGVRFLERNDLPRALKAFKRTVEYEPDNALNHCNLAGVLSEMGNFEASNEILLYILRELDPKMAECQFYLANNYANMGQYEAAEECVLTYLDAAPDGEYVDDAMDMLDVLMDEFGGGRAYAKWEAKQKELEKKSAEQDGRHLLESGQFEAAVEWLEGVIERNPDDLPAYNNLSLAYYYTGQYERAVEVADLVLSREGDNIHALCNLTVFLAQMGSRQAFDDCVKRLQRVFPLHYDYAMKLGTTLGLVGQHAAALDVFHRLVRMVEKPEPVLMHSIAASAANVGLWALARKWWQALKQCDGLSEVAAYYLNMIERAEANGMPIRVSYQYDVPIQVQFSRMKKRMQQGDWNTTKSDPLLRASLYWGLRHGTEDTQKAVIRTLSHMGDADAEKALRAFLQRSRSSALQAAALFALQRLGAHGPVEVCTEQGMQSVQMSELPNDLILQVDASWQQVWELVEEWLHEAEKTRYIPEAKPVWLAFLKHSFLRGDWTMSKPDVWVAGLLYAVLKRHKEPLRQKDIAEFFHVSASSVSKASSRLTPYFVKMP